MLCTPDHGVKHKARLLCLHGKASNPDISQLQLINLGLDGVFDVTHLKGPYESKSPYYGYPKALVGDEVSAFTRGLE
jgi:hypothetical protein